MMNQLTLAALFLASFGCTALGGFYYAFSNSVMKALGAVPAEHGVAAMQAVNIYVPKSLFLVAFFGAAFLCIALAAMHVVRFSGATVSILALAGCAFYLIGSFGVTVVLNVPLNNELASEAPQSAAAAEVWARYLKGWTLWNHVRTVASLLSGALLFISALILGR